jgi:S1-C subfamily serine protease
MNGLVFEATMRVEPGFSGGPVVDRDNNLAGMAIGSNDSDEAQIVPVQVIELLVGT